jgi:hypothetical protein
MEKLKAQHGEADGEKYLLGGGSIIGSRWHVDVSGDEGRARRARSRSVLTQADGFERMKLV